MAMSLVSSIPAMQRTGLRFRFHVRLAALQGIQQGHFQTVFLPVGGHLTVSHKMEKLRLSHLSWNVPLAFSTSLLAFRLRLTVVFSTILRASSGSFPLISPASNIVSPFSKRKDLLFPDFVHSPRQIFPFSPPVYSLYLLEIRVSSAY